MINTGPSSDRIIQAILSQQMNQAPVTGVGRVWNPNTGSAPTGNPAGGTGTQTGAPLRPYVPGEKTEQPQAPQPMGLGAIAPRNSNNINTGISPEAFNNFITQMMLQQAMPYLSGQNTGQR